MEVFEAIKERRSVRHFLPDPLKPEELEAILDAGRRSPSWANTQCWRLVVVSDPAVKQKLAECMPPGNPGTKAVLRAPVTIVVCAKLGLAGYYHDKPAPATDKGDWYMFDCALCVENMCLAATALGLGTVILGLADSARIAQAVGLPEGMAAACMLPLGRPDPAVPVRRVGRREPAEIVFQDRYPTK
jgi:nitroreductase